ncbi:ankyrin [Xylariaceae sp. AK1471]|nr:ankyrin [Xylariaceae sp. AK1471]
MGRGCNLIANYNRGGDDRYLNSELHLWEATYLAPRCTSAAPMFFELMRHSGVDCRDGGLKENNPLHIAVNESKNSGADIPQSRPTSKFIIHRGYLTFSQNSSHLNLRFPGTGEPALDAFEQIDSIESTARAYNKFHERVSNTPFSPISGITKSGMLRHLPIGLEQACTICKIDPSDRGFDKLLKQTSEFKVKKTFYSAALKAQYEFHLNRPQLALAAAGVPRFSESPAMNLEVEFTHQSPGEPTRIDGDFEKSHMGTISGFPMEIKTLLEYWDSSSVKVEPTFFAAELDSTPHIPAAHNDKHDVKLPTRQNETQSSTGERQRSNQEQFVDAAKNGKLDEVKKLLQSGASVQNKYGGWTALRRAGREGHELVVKFLVENGSDLNVRIDVGWGILPGDGSALTWAAGEGHLEVVRYLVARGANLDIQPQKPVLFGTGGTAVTMASGKGNLDVVEFLLESDADKENKDGILGWDAFICACDRGQLKLVEFLSRHGKLAFIESTERAKLLFLLLPWRDDMT